MTADPAVKPYIETAAVGVLVGAGPPLQQLALGFASPEDVLSSDLWAVHCAVVRRANEIRRDELSAMHGVEWLTVPKEVEADDGD